MNTFKKLVLTFSMVISLGASTVALAEDPATRAVTHIEAAIAEIGKHDFNAAYIQEKAARGASDEITGNHEIVQKGLASIIKAQILGKQADTENVITELKKAIAAYKSI